MLLSEFLADYPDVDREAGIELASVAALVQTYDRKGSVTLTVKVEKVGARVMATVGSSAKQPRPDPDAGLWHVGPDGLTKDDPYQGRLDPVTGEVTTAPHTRKD